MSGIYICEDTYSDSDIIKYLVHGGTIQISVDKDTYMLYEISDVVIFENTVIDGKVLKGFISSKQSYPRKQYRQDGQNLDYSFNIGFSAHIELVLE